MAREDLVRIEIGFEGGDVLTARAPSKDVDTLEEELRKRSDSVVELAADDGRYLVALPRVLYLKRFSREPRVGFGRE